MMDCQQVARLLPLWVGQDLPDVATTRDVSGHLAGCPGCDQRRKELQQSLEALQASVAVPREVESSQSSVWPSLVTRISEWELHRRQHRFNGWIPATVMGMAVALMIAVSLPSIRDEFSKDQMRSANRDDLFGTDPLFRLNAEQDAKQAADRPERRYGESVGVPVNFKADQW